MRPGSDWVTTVIAVGGVGAGSSNTHLAVLHMKELGSGDEVMARVGIFPAQLIPNVVSPEDYVFYPGSELLAAMQLQDYLKLSVHSRVMPCATRRRWRVFEPLVQVEDACGLCLRSLAWLM